MERKKQRGQYRKLKSMFKAIDRFTPFERIVGEFEEFSVPSDMFIEHRCTSGNVKTEFCRKWLETTEHFIANKPSNIKFSRLLLYYQFLIYGILKLLFSMTKNTGVNFGIEQNHINIGLQFLIIFHLSENEI